MKVRFALLLLLLTPISLAGDKSFLTVTTVPYEIWWQEPIESTDRVVNRYWEEYTLLYPHRVLYRSILPRLTRMGDPISSEYMSSSERNRMPRTRSFDLLESRLHRQYSPRQYFINRLIGVSQRRVEYRSSFRFRLIPYFEEIAFDDAKPTHRVGINAETWLMSGDYWQVHVRARLENKGELYPQFNGRIWKDKLTGWFDNAALYFCKDGFFGSLGRSFIVWGPEEQDALLFSDNSPAFDRIWFGYESSLFRLEFITAQLDDVVYQDQRYHRYLAAHRLSFRKTGWFELGLSEAVLYGGVNRELDWKYFNPVLSYYWEQWNDRTDDNLFLGADLVVYWPERGRIFGELMVDDFQVDFESEPHQVGYKLGVAAVEPFGLSRVFAKTSYTRVNTTVYGQFQPQNQYVHRGESIGYFDGNDLDRILLLTRYHFSPDYDLELELQLNRKGQGRIARHDSSAVLVTGGFPSGVVEKSWQVNLRLLAFTPQMLEGHLELSYSHFDNYRHLEGETHNRLGVNLLLSWLLAGYVQR